MQFRLRTLMIVLAIGPPMLAIGWWKYSAWQVELAKQKALAAELVRLAFLSFCI